MTASGRPTSSRGHRAPRSSRALTSVGGVGALHAVARSASEASGFATSAVWRVASAGGVRVLAWIWTRILTERLRVATMWWLNEKVAVRVVAVVPGPHGSVLARVRRGRLVLPSVRLGRDADPEASVRALARDMCGVEAAGWVPVDVVRRPRARLDAVFLATTPRSIGGGGTRCVAWIEPAVLRHHDLARWLGVGTP